MHMYLGMCMQLPIAFRYVVQILCKIFVRYQSATCRNWGAASLITLDAWPWLRGMLWLHDVDDNVGISLLAPQRGNGAPPMAHGACFKGWSLRWAARNLQSATGILWKSPWMVPSLTLADHLPSLALTLYYTYASNVSNVYRKLGFIYIFRKPLLWIRFTSE